MKISPHNIRELRNRTGLGLSDCKKALEESNGDVKKAIDKLRAVLLVNASKQPDRMTSDGLIAMRLTKNRGVLIELNCETDFVARNEKFIGLISDLVSIAYEKRCTTVDDLINSKYKSDGTTVYGTIIDISSAFGEKLKLSKLCYLEACNGVVAGYVHGDMCCLGKIGALVALQSFGNKPILQKIGKQIAMHIVAMKPEALSIDNLDQVELNNKISVIEGWAKNLNKTKEITKKIVNAKIAKYYEEIVLLEQKFIMNDKIKVSDFIKSSELSVNSSIKLSDYKLLILGSRS